MRFTLLLILLLPVGCQDPKDPVADALLEALRDAPCTVKELKELYRPGLSVGISRAVKGGKADLSQMLVVDTDDVGFRYEHYKLKSKDDAVAQKTGKRLTRRTWELALENVQCAGLPTTKTLTVKAGTFQCLVYQYKMTMRGVPMKFRVWFSVKHPGLAVLREATAGIGVIRTELVALRVPAN